VRRPALLLLLLLLGAGGCASLPEAAGPAPAGGAAAEATRHLMVTLRPAPPGRLDQLTFELASTYQLEPVAAWNIQALDRRCVVFESRGVLAGRRLETLLRALRGDHRVDLAQSVQHFSTLAEPRTEAPAAVAGSYRHLQHGADTLHLEAAHQMATGRGVKVAVVDTGVDLTHPELQGRIVAAKDFAARRLENIPRGEGDLFTHDLHGTAVAGVIAAARDGVGTLGVAPEAGILALKACWARSPGDRQASCDSYTLSLALDFALGEGAQVINLSWSGPPDPILEALVAAALGRGAVVVAALGAPGSFPARLPGVIAVRSLEGPEDAAAAAAEAGSFAAPGEEILSTVPGGGYDFFSGSSLAAAEVSGIAALVLERKKDLGPAGVAELLRKTARDNPGRAAVDACAPLAALLGGGAGCDRR
jgi:subtilisin family serine protease